MKSGMIWTNGKEFDLSKWSGRWRWWWHRLRERCAQAPRRCRLSLADRLCWLAVKLRGQRWYVSDNYASVPGNRAAELNQMIFERCVARVDLGNPEDQDFLDGVQRDAGELAQLAGEAWGQIWPKNEQKATKGTKA